MITPFTDDNRPDFTAIKKMVDWYVDKGCNGIFAVCQSSEMFFLSQREKVDIARCVWEAAAGRVKVIASGHTSDAPEAQEMEIAAMAQLHLDAVVLVSNRFAAKEESEAVFNRNFHRIVEKFPGTQFGMYECPYPYKRLVEDAFLRECAETGALRFLKDTCCEPLMLKRRAILAAGSSLALFNANSATLLESLRLGYAGFNGIMGNYHPDLYVWLLQNFKDRPDQAQRLSDLLALMAMTEARSYPISAKYHFSRNGVPMSLHSRSGDMRQFNANDRLSHDAMMRVEKMARECLELCER